MHCKIGRYELSNQFIVQYRNKDNLVDLYKQVTQKKLITTKGLIAIDTYIHNTKERMQLNKIVNNNKNNSKSLKKTKLHQLNTMTATMTRADKTNNLTNAKRFIISLNINGLFEDNKIHKLFEFLISKKSDIILLQ